MNTKIEELNARKQEIMADDRLSAVGKQEKLEGIKKEYRALIPGLRKEAIRAAVGAKKLQMARGGAEIESGTEYDYSRLAYESQAARSAIAMKDNFHEVIPVWDQVKSTCDKHKIKAWIDTVPAMMGDIPGFESSGLLESFQDGRRLLQTEEINSFDDRLKALNDELDGIRANAARVEEGVHGVKPMFPTLEKRVFDGIERGKDGDITLKMDLRINVPDGFSEADALYSQTEEKRLAGIEKVNAHWESKGQKQVLDPDLDVWPG